MRRCGVFKKPSLMVTVKTASGLRLVGMPDEFTKRIEANSDYLELAEAGNGKIAASHDQDSKGPSPTTP
jgi:hypothetical protein